MDWLGDGLVAVRLESGDAFCLDEATYTKVPGSVSIPSQNHPYQVGCGRYHIS
jgi:hypothetical protein